MREVLVSGAMSAAAAMPQAKFLKPEKPIRFDEAMQRLVKLPPPPSGKKAKKKGSRKKRR
jgi:hypothetical protein